MIIPILVLYAQTLTRPVAVKVFRSAAKVISRDTGFELQPTFKSVRPGKMPLDGDLLKAYASYASDGYTLLMVRQEPLIPVGGMAKICGKFAVAGIKESERISWVAVAHELGHVLGAQHDTGSSIMNIASGAITKPDIGFSDQSKNEIAFCMRGL